MNEIILRTNKAVYAGGETVYGAVYVNITKPSAARGVTLEFSGIESYDIQPAFIKEGLHSSTGLNEYIKFGKIILHEISEPFPIGSYVFPFQKRLPRDLPGSLCQVNEQWKAEILYTIKAEMIGAGQICTSQQLVIQQDICSSFGVECPTSIEKTSEVKNFFRRQKVTSRLRINKSAFYFGDFINVDLNFIYDGTSSPNFISLDCSLRRELVITKSVNENKMKDRSSFFSKLCSAGMQPERSSQSSPKTEENIIVWHCIMKPNEKTDLHNGFKNLIIPLDDSSEQGCLPTTAGHHIFCLYWLKVEVKIKGSEIIILELPLLDIRCKNKEWEEWKPPHWLHNCSLCLDCQHECAVPSELLDGPAFTSLPCFYVT